MIEQLQNAPHILAPYATMFFGGLWLIIIFYAIARGVYQLMQDRKPKELEYIPYVKK